MPDTADVIEPSGSGRRLGMRGRVAVVAVAVAVVAAVGWVENGVFILLVFYDIQKLKTDRISVLIGKDNKIGIHNCNILLGVLFAAQKHANLKLLYYEEVNLKRKK